MFAHARQLPRSFDNQRGARGWPFHATRAASRLLNRQTVVLLSFGHIARRVAELLAPLGMNIIAVRRRVQGNEPARTVAEAEVETVLPLADHVVNLLPASPATERFLDDRRLGSIKPGAILYNLGRGTTVDQDALIGRLQSGHLAAAWLDVTDPEPLPPDHPLWTTPNCFITPHSAGGHEDELERLANHFLDNLRRFTTGEPLLNRVI
jgi:phosphoglycerate dehydrogenase-like enzyme